ncbi:MAG: hypothetical protein LBH68_00825 [Bifidobacteriaceae bacterium]|jgi:hypothetical protein|nr:hypothetical protein [Bifidobacteriaceae bacterium]
MTEESNGRHSKDARPRPMTWVWAGLLGLFLVAGVVVGYFVIGPDKESDPKPTKPAETITAPAPTPVITPSPRSEGSAFYNSMPSTVGAYVLVGEEDNALWKDAKAFDAYVLKYSDGTHEILLMAGQWRTAEAAEEAFAGFNGESAWPGKDAVLSPTPAPCPKAPDPDTAAIWLNRDAIFEVQAPDGGAARFYCDMPY